MIDPELLGQPPANAARWHVARTMTGREAEAAAELHGAGCAFFAPRYQATVLRRHTKAVRRVESRPLFPGYLFVGISHPSDWRAIHGARAIIDLISNAGAPVPVSAAAIHALHDLCRAGVYDQITRPVAGCKWRSGDRVRVITGPFAGHVMTFKDGRPKRGTARLLAMILGTEIEVSVSLAMLEAA